MLMRERIITALILAFIAGFVALALAACYRLMIGGGGI